MMMYPTRHNWVLHDHVATHNNNAAFMSTTIQNELFDLAASQILNSIVTDCNNADWFTLTADESTDVSLKDYIAMCIRFVHKKPDADNRMKHSVRKEFLFFCSCGHWF